MRGLWAIISPVYKFIAGFGALMVGLFALSLVALTIIGLQNRGPSGPTVTPGSVLVLDPSGFIVEQTQNINPLDVVLEDYTSGPPAETSIHDLIKVVQRAAKDPRIPAMALLTDNLAGGAPAHLHALAEEIREFRLSGKPVYAVSTAYSQGDYLLAAEADKIFLNPAGSVQIYGYASYPTYFKSLLDKIGASVNVFRVGTYKSAVEPFLRDDMSDDTKSNTNRFLGGLWDSYVARASDGRGLEPSVFRASIDKLPERLEAAGGDFATYALQEGLVDAVVDRKTWRQELIEGHGSAPGGYSFAQINWRAYKQATDSKQGGGKRVAVIVAQGELVAGYGPNTVAASETLIRYIRDARKSDEVGAIVLRVNSPGGSAFASELIRQELAAAQADGKPVIASFGPTAASGGYWISASADQIFAEPTTITGSIGIFGLIPTFEGTLAKAGVYSDGVGTTEIAGGVSATRSLSAPIKNVIEQSIKRGYSDFLSLVANGRGMTVEAVDKVAQGQVWTGEQALENGLVDQLGGFQDAVAAAAEAASLDDYEVVFAREPMDQIDQVLVDLFSSRVVTSLLGVEGARTAYATYATSPFLKDVRQIHDSAKQLLSFTDPAGAYALCLTCLVH